MIGLRKSYSVYKIGGIFMSFLLIFFFTSKNRQSAIFSGTATLWWTLRTLLTHFWDHFYSDQCYKNALIIVKMPLAGKGLTQGGARKGLIMFPRYVLTDGGGGTD